MDAAQVQLWIETEREGGQVIVMPIAQSLTDRQLAFRINANCRSESGSSSVSQQGQISMTAGLGTRLARISLAAGSRMECTLEIALRSGGEDAGVYSFKFDVH